MSYARRLKYSSLSALIMNQSEVLCDAHAKTLSQSESVRGSCSGQKRKSNKNNNFASRVLDLFELREKERERANAN
jgi:hypothetical protein